MLTLDQEGQLINIMRLLLDNQDKLLKDFQPDSCGCNGGLPKYVYRNPAAFKIGNTIDQNEGWIRRWLKTQ